MRFSYAACRIVRASRANLRARSSTDRAHGFYRCGGGFASLRARQTLSRISLWSGASTPRVRNRYMIQTAGHPGPAPSLLRTWGRDPGGILPLLLAVYTGLLVLSLVAPLRGAAP